MKNNINKRNLLNETYEFYLHELMLRKNYVFEEEITPEDDIEISKAVEYYLELISELL